MKGAIHAPSSMSKILIEAVTMVSFDRTNRPGKTY